MAIDGLAARQAAVFASGAVYWAGVWVEAARVRRRVGKSPNLRPRGTKERLLWLGWMAVIAVWVGQPLVMNALWDTTSFVHIPMRLAPLYSAWAFAAGVALMVAGQAGTFWCYAALGDSWRIGIRRKEKTNLITCGPYKRVRHPIYAFQMLILAGVALALPTPLSLIILGLHGLCSSIKASDEEAYLGAVHAEEYAAYMKCTGRFVPRAFGRSGSQ